MKSKILEILTTNFNRWTVIERRPGDVDFYLPFPVTSTILEEFAQQRMAGAQYHFHPLPWWANRFTRTNWIVQVKPGF